MNPLKAIWGLLFRLFPCPVPTGLRTIGNPGPESPVLVTCNFYTTVRRLTRALKGLDVWLLVAESKGVNVWCAACGHEFTTQSVVSAIKTSGIDDRVTRRVVILPPLGAAGISAEAVRQETGWRTRWGPVRAKDIPEYLHTKKRTDAMKRATYTLFERLDTALGSLFPFYLPVAVLIGVFAPHFFMPFLATAAGTFLLFFGLTPWIPGSHGWHKVLLIDAILGLALAATWVWPPPTGLPLRAMLLLAMVLIALDGMELGGLSSIMASDLDPFLARRGVRALGNTQFAGTVRTDLLNGNRILTHYPERCTSCASCIEVCPIGVWARDEHKKTVLADRPACTGCTACLNQCPEGAIEAVPAEA